MREKTTHTTGMNKEQAIQILSTQYGAAYEGTWVARPSDDLIQDIYFENEMGQTYHVFGKNMVEDSQLIRLAQHYNK